MFKIPDKIEYVLKKLTQNGYEAYVVGGCVRDMLMGIEPNDFDITTSARPEQVMELFDKTVPTGIKHGTVTVMMDKTPVEVTTFRTDGDYTDHRHPEEICFVTSLEEDLSRRDFTVNAMAYNPDVGLRDYFGGEKDLKARVLRAVGEPQKRFEEDALRIFRLFRFASVLGFECEEKTFNASLKLALTLKKISRERIMIELSKAVMGKNLKVISPLIESGALEFVGVKKTPCFDCISRIKDNKNLSLFAFLYFSSDDALDSLNSLRASNEQKNYAKKLLKLFSMPFPFDKNSLKFMLCASDVDIVNDYLSLAEAFSKDVTFQRQLLREVIENKEPYLISHLAIDGNTLKNMGYKGEEIGVVLERLLRLVIECPEINNTEALKYEISLF